MKRVGNRLVSGFTVVELLVVIVVIGILAGIGTVGYQGWKTSSAQAAVKSDLKSAATAMQSAKNFGSGYPLSLPETFKQGGKTTTSYVSGSSTWYCLQSQSTSNSSVLYHISGVDSQPQSGTCSGSVTFAGPSSIDGCVAQTSNMNVGWPSPPKTEVPSFRLFISGYGSGGSDFDQVISNTLTSQGTFVYTVPNTQGGGFSATVKVQYINGNNEYSQETSRYINQGSTDCYN